MGVAVVHLRGCTRRVYVLESPPISVLVPLKGVGGPTHEYDIARERTGSRVRYQDVKGIEMC